MSRAFVALDGLRGVAALAVVAYHFPAYFGSFVPQGYLAVDLFFVLSGFVLAHAYGERLTSGMTGLEFMRRRLIRLAPLYLLGFAACSALLLGRPMAPDYTGAPANLYSAFAFGLFGLPTPSRFSRLFTLYPLLVPAWSLFFEMVINAIYGGTARYLTDRVLIAFTILAGLALVALTLGKGDLDMGHDWKTFGGGLARVCFSFPAGILAYRLWTRRPPTAAPFWLAAVSVVAIFFIPASAAWRPVVDLTAALIAFPLLVYFAAAGSVGRLAAPCHVLGAGSFAIYALHYPAFLALGLAVAAMPGFDAGAIVPLLGIGALLVLVGFSVLMDEVYDTPVRRWLGRRRASAAAT